MQPYKIVILILFVISTYLINTTRADSSMLKDKPYFTLRLETKGARYEAKINGVAVLRDISQGNMLYTEIPVNPYMRTGQNIISLNLLPMREGGFDPANISLSLYVNQDEAPESEKKLLANIVFTGGEYARGTGIESSMPAMRLDSTDQFKTKDSGDVIIHTAKIESGTIMPNSLKVSQAIELDTPFPEWGFLSADIIDFPLSYKEYLDNDELWDKKTVMPLYQEYQNIYSLLKSNNIDAVLELFKERNQEYDNALYYPKGTYDKKIRDSFTADLKNLSINLRPTNKSTPLISDDKKLIKLGNEGLIYFTNDEESSFTNYEILFYQKNGKWIISR